MAAIDFPSSPVNDQVFGLYKYNSAVGAWLVNTSPLTTLGTVTVGTWNASPIAIAYGGTGATDVAGARANLGLAGLSGIQTFTGSQTFIPSDSGVVPLTVRGLISQSTALTQWVSPTGGSVLAEVDQYGGVKGIYAQFSSDSATTTPLTIKAFTGQSVNIQSWKNVGGADLASVGSDGAIVAPYFVATSNGAGTNFKVGDDAWIGDINVASTIGIRGVGTPANGYIVFGNGNTASLGRAGTGPLNYTGAFSVNSTTQLGQLTVVPGSTSTIGIVTRAMASQTGNLQEWQTAAPAIASYVGPTGIHYMGPTASANITRFPNAQMVVSNTAAGIQQNETHNIGIMSEATAGATGVYGVGVYGVGYTSATTQSRGVVGEGHVSASTDAFSAIGVLGYATDTHAAGANIGMYLQALNSSVGNYALYNSAGDFFSLAAHKWILADNSVSSLSFDSTGKTGILNIITADAAEGVTMSGYLSVSGDLAVYGGDIYTAAATNSGLFSDTTTGNVTIAGALTTGTYTVGAIGSTGAVSLFPATGAQNITLGGATTGTVTLGSTLATAVQLPTGKTKIGTTTLVQGGAVSITLPTLAGALYASGNTDVALLDGGTNASLTAVAGGVVYSGASAMAITAAGTQNQVLKSNVAGAPTWQTLDLTYMPDAAFKKSVLCASTADIDASLSTATTLTGYSAGGISYSCTTTAGSATVNLASGTTAGLKVGATVTVNASFPSVVTVATIVSATQFTVSSGTGIVAGTAIATTFTNTIAALTMDGITPALNDRVLIKNQTKIGGITVTANRDNGIYYLSTLGSASVPWVLTRVTDGDTASEIAGATANVDQGTAQGSQLWSNNFKSTDVLGTTAMVWNRLLNDGDWTTAATASKAVLRGTSGQVTATNYFTSVTTLAADTIALTFSTNAGIQYRTAVAGAITFTGASYTAGSSIAVFITNGATLQTVTFPAGWIFVGAKPTNLAASKSAVLTVTSLGTTEAACIASWAVQT